ncbi:MAG: thioredoxin domain-containing protein [Planctomycetales bacterium]|nr:thioredoxin domain-containing protein [Planctomycetales bacterium]
MSISCDEQSTRTQREGQHHSNFWLMYCYALTASGMVLSAYLLWRMLAQISGVPLSLDLCSAIFGTGCDHASSTRSLLLGVPLAGWGLSYFSTLAALLLLGLLYSEDFEFESRVAILVFGLIGLACSIGLVSKMFLDTEPVCPVCWLIHGVNLAIVFCAWKSTGKSLAEVAGVTITAVKYLMGAEATYPLSAKRRVLYIFCALGLGGFVYQWSLVQATIRRGVERIAAPQEIVEAFKATQPEEIRLSTYDSRLGSSSAPIQLVIFSDFQCPACQYTAEVLGELTDSHADKVSVVFKHFPLCSQCNPLLKKDLHPLAGLAAQACLAAAQQSKFWAFHDALFAADWELLGEHTELFEPQLLELAAQLNLDVNRFELDRRSSPVQDRLSADIEEGLRLKVQGTPTIFMNGRLVTRPSQRTLEILIEHLCSPDV